MIVPAAMTVTMMVAARRHVCDAALIHTRSADSQSAGRHTVRPALDVWDGKRAESFPPQSVCYRSDAAQLVGCRRMIAR